MTDWTPFDHPYPIYHLDETKANVNQSTGAVTAPSLSRLAIAGDLQMDPLSIEGRQPGGIVLAGDAVLYTTNRMEIGDGVETWHDKAGTRKKFWRVVAEEDYAWFHVGDLSPDRPGYVLRHREGS